MLFTNASETFRACTVGGVEYVSMSYVECGLAGLRPPGFTQFAPRAWHRLLQSVKEIGNGLAFRPPILARRPFLDLSFGFFARVLSDLSSQLRLTWTCPCFA